LKRGKNSSNCLKLLIKIYKDEQNYEYIEECYLEIYSIDDKKNKKNKFKNLNKLLNFYIKNQFIAQSSIIQLLKKIENK
jgi:hypothetical protein